MKTIISASRRTDIPSFYLDWFKNAVKQGRLEIRNPFYPKQNKTVDLTPDAAGWIVFWSRNFSKFLRSKDFFDAYNLFFHFTILPKSKLEKAALKTGTALKQMETLVEHYGADRIIWRYDPLVFWQEAGKTCTNLEIEQYKKLCREIGAMGVKRCYTSFVFPYKKFSARFAKKFPAAGILNPDFNRQSEILQEMTDTAEFHGLSVYSCCSDELLNIAGVKKGRCIDGSLLNSLSSDTVVSRAKSPTRNDCGCTKSIDIGDYRRQPCPFGCIYCYANPQWE